MWQNYCTTDLLICVTWVNVQVEGDFDRCVEFCSVDFLRQSDRFSQAVQLRCIDLLQCLCVFLTSFCHRDVPLLFHTFDSDAHIARCSGDNPHCCFYIIGVQIRHLVLSDFSALFQRDLSDDVGFGAA